MVCGLHNNNNIHLFVIVMVWATQAGTPGKQTTLNKCELTHSTIFWTAPVLVIPLSSNLLRLILKMSSSEITLDLLAPLRESIKEKDDDALFNLLPSMTSDQINSGMEEDGNTALHVACVHNNVDAAEELLKIEGVDLNATNNEGETPIMVAVSWLHQELAQILLADLRVNIDVNEDHIGKCVEGEEEAKEEVKTMVAEELKRRVEMMQSKKDEMMQLTQQEREVEEGLQKRGIKEMGVREYAKHAKSRIDEKKVAAKTKIGEKADVAKAKLERGHIKSKLEPGHIKSKLDEKKDFAKTKLDHLKQKIAAKSASAHEQK